MRRSTLWMCALLAIATSGCDKVKQQVTEQYAKIKQTIEAKIAERRGRAPAPAQPAPVAPQTPAATPTPAKPAPAAPPPAAPKPPAQHARVPQIPQGLGGPVATRDLPYSSPDTGTIDPGMSERDIYTVWGPPADVRKQGEYTYIFYPNGCEHSCGTADVVILQNNKVVDAILRWPGHRYSGQSSSPAATEPHPRRGGDTLVTKPPSTP